MESFQEIFKTYYKKIYCFLLKLSGNETLAEELAQETLYKAFLHIEQFQGRCSLYTWLCEIGKNEWLLECRRQKHFSKTEQNPENKEGDSPEQEVLKKQLLEIMRQEIRNLPNPYQDVIVLRVYAELTYKEIAGKYRKTESWAKVTFFRGKAMLAERMEGYR
ncbi:RNA polymerase sigma factor sigM [uncultured Roseburia sp.]|uniref:Sigma-70 family RNA polymerase sigma factor n=1 Tax=Brotonthovivens ammoniilytica TaxID=2981725 RepID=A0ABT2TN85_9FIRM|nr:sigma-70 family RNA polymerase sigma factor [Brotonthovivens ammoniilytica]MCU6763684.1 sigma-70 family RNA polymerase sigma factor [Brotonthovivens ammoniilytica]SCJ30526.1 RNA polymerase sigma factor sigM [uncultured Roseburia sp.]